ncbi:hypothetical protein [Candidatus Protochlamydia phocaeensis]|uniref:hypothetical protein n=1 Tax=Candidatus Protochlamydia phocaeensis TaxID=1414722 RepID=UPI00083802E5|nr:hypothetical protein [Candidatus Protochlamydia phocaeensis]
MKSFSIGQIAPCYFFQDPLHSASFPFPEEDLLKIDNSGNSGEGVFLQQEIGVFANGVFNSLSNADSMSLPVLSIEPTTPVEALVKSEPKRGEEQKEDALLILNRQDPIFFNEAGMDSTVSEEKKDSSISTEQPSGRKRKKMSEISSESALALKEEERLLKNRASASHSRARRKDTIKQLGSEVQQACEDLLSLQLRKSCLVGNCQSLLNVVNPAFPQLEISEKINQFSQDLFSHNMDNFLVLSELKFLSNRLNLNRKSQNGEQPQLDKAERNRLYAKQHCQRYKDDLDHKQKVIYSLNERISTLKREISWLEFVKNDLEQKAGMHRMFNGKRV